ncbi:sulfite exporter TauE/SafE family protein [Companilactobacillus sp.]|uniref:sulfite exporter TauE/SafE family protein n=1 Tax=Companilactobacillus sp. TaxID=2767905 RepID=UPI0025C49FDF|nr:sulfite exporter TauE/SafE family protein [Companilactobacillus sp.]MCH4008185.1 sulfite exporter TauE/SafE family protein [Companilactobacillus sp.]MCH4051636.1 sulfite exporter TauE/SafE family protein [Companilactobacillus sp.]MCH4076128.1 sulfite exporter TauE/SafE family protein [Companilactobacillus sp.]MCH4124703.1 sulfite exporter TauE/SafE family protein [Companilactobacillus sp.]MCH4131245.1 sulfite exporter TauE/SafE family protein [Companilactobacillus sp.]
MYSWVFIIILVAMMAGFVQGVTGFGSGIVMMVFLPHILPISQSAGVSTLTMIVANFMVFWHYRKHLHWQRLVRPFSIYIVVAIISLYISQFLAPTYLKILLGVLLVCLSLYYTIMNVRKINVSSIPLIIMVIFSIISGFFNGMFGIGGPLMALYFLTISKTKETYLASIQAFFLIDTVIMTSLRFSMGVLDLNSLKYVAVGIIGAVIGTILANRLVRHLNINVMTIFIYIFIGISGLYYLITALI